LQGLDSIVYIHKNNKYIKHGKGRTKETGQESPDEKRKDRGNGNDEAVFHTAFIYEHV
jgi:hypothetical protein